MTVDTCDKCPHKNDYTPYYQPREGGVIYCGYEWLNPEHRKANEAYAKMAKAANL